MQVRIRLEAEAVLFILGSFETGSWEWISSEVLQAEINRTPDTERKSRVRSLFERAHNVIQLQSVDLARAEQIMKFGFKGMDSLHIACAERAECDVFLTTDDRLLAASERCAMDLHIRIANPMKWLDEVIK